VILAGDIGGTKTTLGLFEPAGGALKSLREETFPSREYDALSDVIDAFLPRRPAAVLDGACFGVAGAVDEGRANVTNLPWVVEESALAQELTHESCS
jgi:glucokinase